MITEIPGIQIYCCVIMAILGMVMGSFLNCTAIRLINGESVVKGRSHCAVCGHELTALDLVPVFSWVFLRGRCRYCGEKISVRYPLTELFAGAVFVTLFLRYGHTLMTVEMLLLAMLLLLISFTDIEGFIIPNWCIIVGIVIRAIFILIGGNILSDLITSLIGGFAIALPVLIVVLIMEKVLGREAMGGGDIKLLFMAGLYFPWAVNLFGFLSACFIGIVVGLLYARLNDREDRHFPFGPSIAAGVWIGALFGEQVIAWYMGLF